MLAYAEALRYLQRHQPNALILTAANARAALIGNGIFLHDHAVNAAASSEVERGSSGSSGSNGDYGSSGNTVSAEKANTEAGKEVAAPLALLATRSTHSLSSNGRIPTFTEGLRVVSEETEALCCALAFVSASPTATTTPATMAAAKVAVALVVQWHSAHDEHSSDLISGYPVDENNGISSNGKSGTGL